MDRPTASSAGPQERRQRATHDPRRHAVRVVAVRRTARDLDRLVAALLALAMAELDAERAGQSVESETSCAEVTGAVAVIEQSSGLR